MSLSDQTLIALCALLVLELALLRRGQRRLFWIAAGATRSRVLAYALAAPGTALHEAAHYLACLALGVPITGRVRLFWPQLTASGDVVLGSVPHARTGALRQALISIAPLLLVPAVLTLATALLLAPHTLGELPNAITQIAWWRAALLAYLSLSCAQAAFPSSGDHIGVLGGVCLGALLAATTAAILALGSERALLETLAATAGVLALPAVAAAVSMLALGLLRGLAPARP
jgi:hypothetical protein